MFQRGKSCKNRVQILLLETWHDVWEGIWANNCSMHLRSRAEKHTEIQDMGIFSNKEEYSKSNTRQRRYPKRSAGVLSEKERSMEVKWIIYTGQSFWVFVYPWPIIFFLSSHLTGPWILPKMQSQLFAKMDPTAQAYGCMSTLIMGWGPLPFPPQEAFLHMCPQVNLPWPQEWAPYLLVLLELGFTTSFVLGQSGWKHTPLVNYHVSSPEANCPLPHFVFKNQNKKEIEISCSHLNQEIAHKYLDFSKRSQSKRSQSLLSSLEAAGWSWGEAASSGRSCYARYPGCPPNTIIHFSWARGLWVMT